MADPYGADSLIAPARRSADPYGDADSFLLAPRTQAAPPDRVRSISEAIASGMEDSGFIRLMRGGKGPSRELPDDAPWYYRVARAAGGMVGDFVPSVAGAVAATPTGPVGMMAGGFAAPMALREAVVEAYANDHAFDLNGVLEVGKAALKGGAKGTAIGVATGGVGKFLAPVVGGGAKGAVALTAAEVGTMTSVASVLEGKVPTWQDFTDNAILLGGVKAAVGTAKTLRRVWTETGKLPDEVRADAARDPKLAEELRQAYHGTATEFSEFKGTPTKTFYYDPTTGKSGEIAHAAVYVTESPDLAAAWSRVAKGESPRVVPVEVRGNLLEFDAGGQALYKVEGSAFKQAMDQGKAGVRFKNVIDAPTDAAAKPSTVYAVFDAARVRPIDKIPAAYEPLALQERIRAATAADPRPEVVSKILTDPNWKPTADDPPPVKTDYITDNATLQGVYREVGRAYAKEIDAARRGVRTNKATMADAYEMVFGDKLEPHKVGTAENAEVNAARLIVAKSALSQAEKARQAHLANPLDAAAKLEWLGAIDLLAAVQRDVRASGAELGRAMQIRRAIKHDPSMLVDAEVLLSKYDRSKTPIGDLMAAFDALKDPSKQLHFAKGLKAATTFEKVIELWRAGIFSGPLTWEANILGNTAKWATDLVEKPVAAVLEAGLTKDPLTAAQFKARALSPFYGLQWAVMDGLKLFKETADVLKTQGVKAAARKVADLTKNQNDKIEVQSASDPTAANPLEAGAGRFSQFFFGALKLQDLPFRNMGERMEAYTRAVDRTTRETKFSPGTPEWRESVARFTQDPTFGLTAEKALEVSKAVEAAGDAAVFSTPLGRRASMASAAIAGTPWELLFPARRTPANILDWAVQHTPGLNLLSSRWRADFEAGGAQRAQAIARVVVGTGLASLAYWMAQEGLLTGGNLADKDTSGTREGAGMGNYSFKAPDGKFYSIARIEPAAKVMMLAADLVEISKSPKLTEEDKGKAVAMMVLAFANATVSTTYLSGLANFVKAVSDPERYGEVLMESYATTLVPKVVGQPTTLADPYKREVDGVIDAIQSQLPFLREQLVAKRDVWGEKVKNERLFAVTPIAAAPGSEEKVKTEAVRLYMGIARAPDYILERGPLRQAEKRTKLLPEQKDIMQEVSGKFAMQELSRIVGSPDWEKIPDIFQVAIYRKVLEQGRKLGENAALPPDAPERVARRDKMLREILRQQDAAGQRSEKRVRPE